MAHVGLVHEEAGPYLSAVAHDIVVVDVAYLQSLASDTAEAPFAAALVGTAVVDTSFVARTQDAESIPVAGFVRKVIVGASVVLHVVVVGRKENLTEGVAYAAAVKASGAAVSAADLAAHTYVHYLEGPHRIASAVDSLHLVRLGTH